MKLEDTTAITKNVLDEIERTIVGKRDVLRTVMATILSGGHVLFEDYPGLAKTLIARCFADVLGLSYSRIQFTPDLLPADITGSAMYHEGEFEFRKGPIFANLVLGDEINRAPPKTQAALLEAMQEAQVTVEDSTYPLDAPFVVIATQNPIEVEGTYPLPEAQLDRFMSRMRVGYPSHDDQWDILNRRIEQRRDEIELQAVVDAPTLLQMTGTLEEVHVSGSLSHYMIDLVEATRVHPDVLVGASPRGVLALMKMSRATAVLNERDFVTPDDVKAVAVAALGHRLTLRPESWVRRISGDEIVDSILGSVATPPAETDT
ncbi:MAG: AAA family ATPase [Actinomycetota bacterium]